jgi:hypothetical protein
MKQKMVGFISILENWGVHILFSLSMLCFIVLLFNIGNKQDEYEEGMHWDYYIECENGFAYKIKDKVSIQVLNSDGTPLKCGQKIY